MSVLNWAIRGDEDDAVSERFVQLMDSLHVDTWYENFFRDPCSHAYSAKRSFPFTMERKAISSALDCGHSAVDLRTNLTLALSACSLRVNAIDSYVSAGIPANWSASDQAERQAPFPTRREEQRRAWVALGNTKGLQRKCVLDYCTVASSGRPLKSV